jgi:hypothetical protein
MASQIFLSTGLAAIFFWPALPDFPNIPDTWHKNRDNNAALYIEGTPGITSWKTDKSF